MKKIILGALLVIGSLTAVNAQSKMGVGVKSYTVYDKESKTDVVFKDFEGSFDTYDFNNLDSSISSREYKLVYDEKRKTWRLPFAGSESLGLVDQGAEAPIETVIVLGSVKYVIRQRID